MMISRVSRTRRPPSNNLFPDSARARIFTPDPTGSYSTGHPDDLVSDDPFFGFGISQHQHQHEPAHSEPEIAASDCDHHHDPSIFDSNCANFGLLQQILLDDGDAFRKAVTGHVSRAAEVFSCLRSDRQIMLRNVMAYLRNCGYNAAVCKTKWPSSGGLSAGCYQFIDVLRADNSARYFVDLDFAAEFEIARPTDSYERLLYLLPRIFVGTGDDLKQILKVTSDSARRSLKSRGLHLPPWRKHRFMQNKWLGPNHRTTNLFQASFAAPPTAPRRHGCKSRVVGFSAAVDGRHLLFPAAAQTR